MAQHDDRTAAEAVRQEEKQAALFAAEINQAITVNLQSTIGRRLLWRLLQIGGVGKTPYVPGERPLDTAFRCGELNVGQQILDLIISADPAGYLSLQQENLDAARSRPAEPEPGTQPDASSSLLEYPAG